MPQQRTGSEPDTLSGSVLDEDEVVVEAEVEIEEEIEDLEGLDDHGSIDRLLAETDQGWDIDAQVETLKAAAGTLPLAEQSAIGMRAPMPSLAIPIPTPFELGAQPADGSPAGGLSTEPSPLPHLVGSRRSSKAPPPLPRKGPPPLPPPTSSKLEVSPVRLPADMSQPGALIDLLHARVTTLERTDDKIGLARTHMELATASESILGDDARAIVHAEAALKVDPTSAGAHAMLRRKRHARGALATMLEHLESELRAATTEAHKVELLAEKARLLEALGDRGHEVRATWDQALVHAPNHAAALKGLEVELLLRAQAGDSAQDWDSLAVHLGRMGDAYGSEKRLAAWLHVERANILERRLGRVDAARGALERALELYPAVGPVRDALVRHVAGHADWGGLARLLDEEARIESNVARAARLELDAAAISAVRLGDRARACELLERAAARAPTAPSVDHRVLDELVRLHEADGQWTDAAVARRARLRFVTDPAALAYELRSLAATAERNDDLESAIADVQRALGVDATDPTLVEMLDRLLAAAGKHDQRIATWLQEGARTEDAALRSRSLARAAKICEDLGRRADAVRHLRSAWIATPGDAEVLDSLARLLAPVLSESVDAGARSLVELYAQAAEQASDVGRKVAYLEKVGLLWEELLGDPARAARAYEQVLEVDKDRRSALLGLERSAARLGDDRMLARALLHEARVATDGATRLSLRTRAASALSETDPPRGMQLVREVLHDDPVNPAARALETSLEEAAGRWELAAASLQARIEMAPGAPEKVALWLALAHMQHTRLHKPLEAMRALEQARALDPAHPVPPQEIARVLEDHGDARALRDAIERLADHATTAEDRARHLTRAAEIDELRLGDDDSAQRTYQRALAEVPDEDLVAERLARVVARRGQHSADRGLGELAALLGKRLERAASPSAAQAMSFELAALLVQLRQEPARATSLLEGLVAEQSDHVPALRTLETLRRRAGDAAPLARVLTRQSESLIDARARLGALWNLAALEEWRLPAGDPAHTYRSILELDPTDPGALEATLRREMGSARRGDPRARRTVIGALRALVPFASDEDTRLALQLRLALLLETAAEENPESTASEDMSREALTRYRDALRIDELSVTASTSVARLAGRLMDTEAALAAARSLAELAIEPRVRSRYLVDAAELLLGPDDDDRLGSVPQRRTLAASMLERALDADADSIPAAGRLATVLLEDGQGERLVSAFRGALGRAKASDALVMLGSEIARVARDELQDLTVAIDAMRRVRSAVPQHVPSLLTLAELCIAQRSWPEAVDALEAVVSTSRDVPPKLTALFALSSIYEKVLSRPTDVDRVLRSALGLDPTNARALRSLLRRVAGEPVADDEAAQRVRREEIADLLARLARVEKDPEQKTGILQELAEVSQRLGDARTAERALIEAVATSPANARAFARLAGLFRRQGRDATGYARALAAVIALGQELGHIDARWFAALGTLEIQQLGRLRDGIAHLQRAIALDPTLYETRFELASAYDKMGAHDEASRTVMAMIVPSAHPLLSVADPSAGLILLEQSLSKERRPDEAVVVSELRALAGELEEGRRGWLRARRPAPLDTQRHTALDRPALVTHVLPSEGRHILLEVAAAVAGVEAKMMRSELSELGISSRDRVTSRSGHPTRIILDRVAKQLGVSEIELAIAPAATRTRVIAQDVPWVVVPAALVEQTEMAQVATIARTVARVAYGVPWLEELAPSHVLALLVAAARQVVPGYGTEDLEPLTVKLLAQNESSLAKSLTRRQKKLLDELSPHIASAQSRPPKADVFVHAMVRAELRTAFVVTGDLLTLLDEIRSMDPALRKAADSPGPDALAAVLDHSLAGDVVRFALTPEATALRRRLGSIWT